MISVSNSPDRFEPGREIIFERDSGDKDKTVYCLNRSSFDKLDLSSAEFACSLKMDQRRILYAINLCIDCACLMDLAKAFNILQLSCAGCEGKRQGGTSFASIIWQLQLRFPSRFTYSDVKEVGGDSSFVLQNLTPANLLTLTVFKTTASSADAKQF